MQLGSFLCSVVAMHSTAQGSVVEWSVSIVEDSQNLALVLVHLLDVGKGPDNSAPLLVDEGTHAMWLGWSHLADEHLVTTDDRIMHARCV